MNKYYLYLILVFFSAQAILSQSNSIYPIKTVDLSKVEFTDGFWNQRYETNRDVTLPHLFQRLKESGRIDNLLFASKNKDGVYCTNYPFDESDIYKSIEAASYILMLNTIPGLEEQLDSLILIISNVQLEDGYLYSARNSPSKHIMKSIGPKRWSNLQWSHELYNVGHLYEAAVAHYNATGKSNLLNIAIKNAELILSTFGPNKLQIPPGHQEIELGLMKLFEVTGNKEYANLAKYFLDIRGHGEKLTGRESWGEYAQDHIPVTQQKEAVGHAVRAAYQYSAMTDIAAVTQDNEYDNAINTLWDNLTTKKLYITGGIGSTGAGEALGPDYDLPNLSAYNETCSSIANMMWNYKMFQLYGDGKYLDVFERTLYNAFLSGVGMEGNLFFYPNPLATYGSQIRAPWFTCACCPPNIARFIASLPSKIYTTNDNDIFVNLYSASSAEIKIKNSLINIEQVTDYPWSGSIKFVVSPQIEESEFILKLRIPGWAIGAPLSGDLYKFMDHGGKPSISINGVNQKVVIENGFASLNRKWKSGDIIELNLPMKINRVVAIDKVKSDLGKVALQRGPIVYCFEWPENGEPLVDNFLLDDSVKLFSKYENDLLNGVSTISGSVTNFIYSQNELEQSQKDFKAIPYYSWAHRGKGEMTVWLNRDKKYVKPVNGKTLIERCQISSSAGINIYTLNDKVSPENSETPPYFETKREAEKEQWIKIDFPEIAEISFVEIFWVSDLKGENIKLPTSWKIQYNINSNWSDVYPTEQYTILNDQYSSVAFETVKTGSLKILVGQFESSSVGIYEIRMK